MENITYLSVNALQRVMCPLQIYLGCTVLASLCDSIDFVIQIIRFGRAGDEYSDILLLAACFVYIISDSIYLCWAIHFIHQLPDEARIPI
jgi:hypothetical protein